MSSPDFIFVYPLLGADDSWSGYRVEFAPGLPDRESLARPFSSPLLEAFDQRHPWLLPALDGKYDAGVLTERSITVFSANPDPEKADEQRELEALPALVDTLEAEQAGIRTRLADGSLYATDPAGAAALAQREAAGAGSGHGRNHQPHRREYPVLDRDDALLAKEQLGYRRRAPEGADAEQRDGAGKRVQS